MQFVLEPVPAGTKTAVGQIVDAFALDGEALFKTAYRVIVGKERPLDSLEPGKLQRRLLSSVNRDFWSQGGQLGKAAQGGQCTVRTGSGGVEEWPGWHYVGHWRSGLFKTWENWP